MVTVRFSFFSVNRSKYFSGTVRRTTWSDKSAITAMGSLPVAMLPTAMSAIRMVPSMLAFTSV